MRFFFFFFRKSIIKMLLTRPFYYLSTNFFAAHFKELQNICEKPSDTRKHLIPFAIFAAKYFRFIGFVNYKNDF